MLKDNKGFSFIEMIVVMMIIFVLSGLSMVTFNMANSKKPFKMKDNLVTNARYAKQLVMAENKDYCVAIMQADDDNYYAIIGTASGNTLSELRSSFLSQATVMQKTTDKDGNVVKKKVIDYASGFTLDELQKKPTKAQNFQDLGKLVHIQYFSSDASNNGSMINIGKGSAGAVIIKYSKHDGSVECGSGEYRFFKYRSNNDIACKVKLMKSTGNFVTK